MRAAAAALTTLALVLAAHTSPAIAGESRHAYRYLVSIDDTSEYDPRYFAAHDLTVTASMLQVGLIEVASPDRMLHEWTPDASWIGDIMPDVSFDWLSDESLAVATGVTTAEAPEPYRALQWSLDKLGADRLWQSYGTGGGSVVAVLDNGVDADHPDLEDRIDTTISASFVQGEPDAIPDGFGPHHGTHVAGIIAAADNGIGTVGVAPAANLAIVKVLPSAGPGELGDIVAGLVYAADADADVINMSFGSYLPRSGFTDDRGTVDPSDDVWISAADVSTYVNIFKNGVQYAVSRGAVLVASAGNSSIDRDHDADLIHLPSDLPSVVAVSGVGPMSWAVDSRADLTVPGYYTNYGQSAIDYAAPGGNVDFGLLTSSPPSCTVGGITRECWVFDLVLAPVNGGWNWMAGTSMAAAHTSGVAAVLAANNSPKQISLLGTSVDLGKPGRDDWYGMGLITGGHL